MRTILIATSTLPRWGSDPEPRFVLDLARHLPSDWEPLILAPAAPGAADREYLDGVEVKRYRYAPFRSWETLCAPGSLLGRVRERPLRLALVPGLLAGLQYAVAAELRRRFYDCVHAHWLFPQGLVHAFGLAAGQRAPLVVTSHGGDLGLARRSRALRLLLRGVIRRCDAVTVVAPEMRSALAACDPGLDVDEVPVIPMGVDATRFRPALRDSEWPRRHGLHAPVALFVGRLVEKKGVAALLEAFARVPPPATLAICGDGPQAAELRQRAAALGIAGRVRFLGAMEHDQLAPAYASCDVFCAPSVPASNGDLDGMPTVLAEAAASGLPLLGSDLAGLPLMVEPGRSGVLVPPGDVAALTAALTRLLGDADLRGRLGAGALAKARELAWPRIAARFVDVYAQAAQAHPLRQPGFAL
jgi:glycosyltransferase involved in cell wall biosynthesis